jgi:hypothetical protein
MCVGEKRKLKIPAKMGYGERGSPPKIPGMADNLFACLAVPCEEINECIDSLLQYGWVLPFYRISDVHFNCMNSLPLTYG